MNDETSAIKKASNAGLIWGVITLVLGILAIASPKMTMATGLAVSILVGIALIAAGLAQTIFAFQAPSLGRGILRFLFGGFTLLIGIAMIAQPGVALASLTLMLAVYFFVDGVFTIIAAWNVKPESGWGWLMFNGVVTVILGYLIWSGWPLSGAWAIGVLVGVRLLMSGITMILLGSAGRKMASALGG
jgi:uncharacterized membrane protein HdeD (DUF308 family)